MSIIYLYYEKIEQDDVWIICNVMETEVTLINNENP